jgi:hypothetical protein
LRRGIVQAVIDTLERHAPADSVAGIVAMSGRGERPFDARLLASIQRGLTAVGAYLDGTAAASVVADAVASEMAGRGPGLTPSGDDVLVGVMHAVTVWPALTRAHDITDLRVLLRDASAPRTTRISRAYLAAAAEGYAAEPWHTFIASLAADDDSVLSAARALLRIGETSGADALSGFCWAWRRLVA